MPDRISCISLYAHDFMADIGHLGNTELGIYWRLLLVYYRDLQPLPSDIDKLRRLAMTFSPEEHRSLEGVVADFFVPTVLPDGTKVYRHKRADIEIEKARGAKQKHQDGANKTNFKRWGSLSDRSAIGQRSDSDRSAVAIQIQIQKQKIRKASATVPVAGFEEFWKAYPKRRAKADAVAAWNKLNPDESLIATMLDALSRWVGSEEWMRDGGQWIPYPATWINKRRWEDELPRRKVESFA